jgi:hypothetical protein
MQADSNAGANARGPLQVPIQPGGRAVPNEGTMIGGRTLVSVLVQMDKDFQTKTYAYTSLLRMLANWGAIVSFLFITFGFTAMKVNQAIFMAQLGERDLAKMQKDNFDSHGRLRVKTFETPVENKKRAGEPLNPGDMAAGIV